MLVEPAFGTAASEIALARVLCVADAVDVPEIVPPLTAVKRPPVTVTVNVSDAPPVTSDESEPVARSTAVWVVPEPSEAKRPIEAECVATPSAAFALTFVAAALADGTATTESSPAPSADTATSAMRLRSVFVDMFFLSLVRFRNFLDLARRSFDLLIPYPVAHTCNAAKIRKSI